MGALGWLLNLGFGGAVPEAEVTETFVETFVLIGAEHRNVCIVGAGDDTMKIAGADDRFLIPGGG